jgi:hypothetical protein
MDDDLVAQSHGFGAAAIALKPATRVKHLEFEEAPIANTLSPHRRYRFEAMPFCENASQPCDCNAAHCIPKAKGLVDS